MSYYKYYPTTALKYLPKCTLRFSPPKDFNDPFDLMPSAEDFLHTPGIKQLKAVLTEAPLAQSPNDPELTAGAKIAEEVFKKTTLDNARKHLYEKMNQRFRVLCLSKAPPDSASAALMWGHYAQDIANKNRPHGGFALEFDENHPWFTSHTTQSNRMCKTVSYQEERGSIKTDQRSILFIKSRHWAYEQEVRFIRDISNGTNELFGEDTSIATYPPEMLRAVYIGLYAQPEIEDDIKNIRSSNKTLSHIDVKRIRAINPTEFKFEVS